MEVLEIIRYVLAVCMCVVLIYVGYNVQKSTNELKREIKLYEEK